MHKFKRAAFACVVACGLGLGGEAGAQSVPNLGNYEALAGLFRIGVKIGPTFSDSYGVSTADDATDFLSQAELSRRYPGVYTGVEAVQGVLDFRGVPLIGSFAAGSTTFQLRVPAFDEPGKPPYLLTFTGPTRAASYQAFKDYYDDIDQAEAERLIRLLLRALSKTPMDPLAGNPGSLQGGLVRNALDLSDTDNLVEGGGTSGNPDPWMVGMAYTNASSGRFSSDRIDAHIQRSFRFSEGSRARLKFDMPISYMEVNHARSASIAPSISLEVPIMARWSLEPRLAYGVTASDELGSLGHMVSATVASRFRIDGLGRGYLVVADMAGYTTTLSTAFTGYNINPRLQNWVFRNGLAYEMPLKMQVGGRASSVRASYTMTNFTGDDVYAKTYHEGTLSFGVRSRGGEMRNTHDLFRINITGLKAKHYSSVSAGIGYRF